jgi:hypothetical protein
MMIKVGVRGDHTAKAVPLAALAVLLAPGTAFAGQPVTQTLNPPPPSFEIGKRSAVPQRPRVAQQHRCLRGASTYFAEDTRVRHSRRGLS